MTNALVRPGTIEDHSPFVRATAAKITTSGSAAAAAMPFNSDGSFPIAALLAATAACYVRLNTPADAFASAVPAAGTGYAIGEQIVLAGGTYAEQAILEVATTQVVSATIAAAGTGGTPGAATVTGTTGTGTKFQAAVTIGAGGDITSVNSISLAGDYTVDPTDILAEPVTGGSLTGAELTIVLGVLTVVTVSGGRYTAHPSNPVSQDSTDGVGAGATFTIDWEPAVSATSFHYLVQPGVPFPVSAVGVESISAIQVTGAGILSISPME